MTRGMRWLLGGLLALVLAASVAPGAALAEPGPFWHHRPIGGTGNGLKIDQPKDESFQGKGGRQIFVSDISGTHIEIEAQLLQAKGILYNTSLQGQFKLLQKYHFLRLLKPGLKECEVKLGLNNELSIFGHLAWKWNGTTSQLIEQPQKEQKPTGVGLSQEIKEGAEELPKGMITFVTLAGGGCGVLSGKFNVAGSVTSLTNPSTLETWGTKIAIIFPGLTQLLHFWNGKEFIGAETSLTVGENPISYTGQSEVFTSAQEVAVFEK
jgi:hypothetical protein